MEDKFLTKNTKITLKEDTNYLTPEPNGLRTAKKVWDEDGTTNKEALKAIAKKLEDYYGDELKELDPVPKVTADDEIGSDDVDIFSIEALGSGKMSALEYEAEGSEVEKKFQKRVDDLNDTSEYDKDFGTKDGFGETDEPDETYEKLKKAAAEYNKYEDAYELPNPLRVTQAKKLKAESKKIKKNKMKRLNFKNEFKNDNEMLQLIPENYKTQGNIFLMTDSNKTYKVRWDSTLKEGTILGYKNKSQINEDIQKMKKLYNYDYSDSMGKTNDYVTEKKVFTYLMENVKKNGSLLVEQDDKYADGETIKAVYNIGGNKLGFQLATKVDKETKDEYPSHLYVSVNGKGKTLLKPTYKLDSEMQKLLATLKPSAKGTDSALSAFNKFKQLATSKFADVNFSELESTVNNKNAKAGGSWIYANYMSPNGEEINASYDKDGKVYTISGKAYPVIKGEGNSPAGYSKFSDLTITTPSGKTVKIPVQYQTASQIKSRGGLVGLAKKNRDTYSQLTNLLGNLESGSYGSDIVNNLFNSLV